MSVVAAPAGDVHGALAAATGRLALAGADSPRLDAELLLAGVLAASREELLVAPRRPLSAVEERSFEACLARREAREPVARILGAKEFWSLDFALNAATLVPRPDSETLVAAALAESDGANGAALRILDLGVGSGCLLLALLSELPRATGLGVDCDEGALGAARENAGRLGLGSRAAFLLSDWYQSLEGDGGAERFDLILSNPPYIETGAIAGLAPEVAAFEPRRALDGGADGLAAYRQIAAGAPGYLAPGGRLILEMGAGQGVQVLAILESCGLAVAAIYDDLAGIPRVLSARMDPPARSGVAMNN